MIKTLLITTALIGSAFAADPLCFETQKAKIMASLNVQTRKEQLKIETRLMEELIPAVKRNYSNDNQLIHMVCRQCIEESYEELNRFQYALLTNLAMKHSIDVVMYQHLSEDTKSIHPTYKSNGRKKYFVPTVYFEYNAGK